MKLLVDTHALLWFQAGDKRLSRGARKAMEAQDHSLVISAATVWEMAIKASLDRLHLSTSVDDYIAEKITQGYEVWPVRWEHASRVQLLPWHHRDPFDRLIAAQALLEKCTVVTSDRVFRKYGVDVLW